MIRADWICIGFLISLICRAVMAAVPGETEWQSLDERASPLYSATQCRSSYDIDLHITADGVQITVLREGKSLYSFRGHGHTVFGITNGILYYVAYHPDGQGGRVIAVDMSRGQQLWATDLEGLPPVDHSLYKNRLNLEFTEPSAITILGRETTGEYVEILDLKTGKQKYHAIRTPTATTTPASAPSAGTPQGP